MMSKWFGLDLGQIQHGREIVASILIDSVGSGLLLPFVPLYFAYRAHMSLAAVGSVMTLAAVIALPSATVAGMAVSRFGASRTIQAINYARAVATVLALFSVTRELALVAIVVSTVGDNSFWSSNATFVADVSGEQRRRWYALERVARNAAMGLGALTAGIVVTTVGDGGLVWFMVVNGASFVVAALLLRPVDTPSRPVREASGRNAGAMRRALQAYGDARFDAFLVATVLLTVPLLAMPSVLALTLAEHARWDTTLAGALIALNVGLIVIGQPALTRWTESRAHRTMLWCAGASALAGCASLAAAFVLPAAGTVVAAIAGILLVTASEMLCNATLNDLVARLAPDSELPQYMSAYSVAWSVGGLVWPVATLSLAAHGGVSTWAVLAGCGAVAALLALVVPRPSALTSDGAAVPDEADSSGSERVQVEPAAS